MKKAAASVLLLGVTALMAWFHRGVGAFVPVEVATAPRFGTTTTTTKKYRCGVPPCPQRPTRTATTTIISSRLLVVSKPTTTSLYQHPQHAQHQQRSLQALLEHHHVTFAGSIWPIVQKLHLNPQKASAIVSNVHRITDWKGLALLTLLAFGLTPLSKFVYRYCHQPQNAANVDGEGTRDVGHDAEDVFDETTYGTRHRRRGPSHRPRKKARTMVTGDDTTTTTTITDAVDEMYRTKKRFGVVAFVDQMAKVALSVYAVDVLSITLTTLGFAFCKQWRISEVYAKFAYTVWAVQRFLVYKKIALCRFFRVDAENMGRVEIFNRLLNGVIVTISTLIFLDWMSVKMNHAVTGLFAFGSAGTLAFTLASQGLVTQLLSGLFLMFSDKMYVGDSVVFGDGTSGKVMQLGWMETLLRDSNNVVTRVPNTLLSSQKVSNLSRIRQSQVKQTLRFHYEDANVLPQLLEDIKTEIRAASPRLITDSSRPFRAFWTDYCEDYLEVMIDTHFHIAPFSDAYWINRQNVLMAITRAIAKHGVELVPGKRQLVVLPRTVARGGRDGATRTNGRASEGNSDENELHVHRSNNKD